ncbi:MAG: ATP-binding protein [Gammaproteobacteria bacterium]
MRRREVLARLYPSELLAETVRIAERCSFSLDELRYEYPEELVPAGETPARYLRDLTERGMQRRTGWKSDEAAGQPLETVFHIVNENTRKTVENPATRALKEGIIVGLANRTILIAKDGTEKAIDDSAAPIRDEQGKLAGVVLIFRDISERRRVDNELRQYAADLAEIDRRKNEFLAMLAHELRNPLAPIRNAVQVLQLTGGDAGAVKSASAMLERQVGQMVRLVDDLLDVSRISRGKIELCKEQVELASVVNQAVEAARSLVECIEHELTVTLPPQPVYLNADPTRLAQVVGNLLNNACKFTNKGGRVCLTVEREGEQAVIRVRDNGIGIATDHHSRIFDIFTQVDTSLERSVGGLGIGLMLVKNLVEMHEGMVEVHSAGLGQGSEFAVRLPILVETAKPPPEPTVSEPTPTTARRILVVDDNRDSAESLAMLLNLMGNETHTAYDGLEAVEAAATVRPDVILLDIGLPKLNGYEACRRIREQPWGKNMVLVALTGWGQEEDRRKSREAGFDGHIVKPVDHAALTKLLAEVGASAPPAGDCQPTHKD